MSRRSPRATLATAGIVAAGIVGILIGGCTLAVAPPVSHLRHQVTRAEAVAPATIRVFDNLKYGEADGEPLLLDLCEPAHVVTPTVSRWPAVILVHGGSWMHGDKSGWRGICRWMASEGFVAAAVDYRLAPEHVFPAGIDDLETAVRWLKSPRRAVEYSIDPAHVGAFGGSAGGNLVSLLGVGGTGSLDRGDRVDAVAELSGPINLTSDGDEHADFYPYELSYLGCRSYSRCPQAVAASPIFHVAAGDPPFFIAQSTDELIPLAQSETFVAALQKAGVPTEFTTRPGDRHSLAVLDPQLKRDILAFFKMTLGEASLAKG